MSLTFGDLFCGAGGMSLGLVQAGLRCVWAVDHNADACETHRRNIPGGEVICADVRELNGYDLADVDLICGGPPCQPFSVAGKHLGDSDPRNMLPHFMRLVLLKRPRWVLMENVRGVRHAESYDRFVRALERAGYQVNAGLLDAADYGVPQRRKRWFLVATTSPVQRMPWPEPTTLGGLLGRGPVTVREAIGIGADVVAPTLASGGHGGLRIDGGSGSRRAWNRLGVNPNRLSIEEMARLQGFPTSFVFVGSRESQARQVGNAVPPPVARAWGEAILRAEWDAAREEAYAWASSPPSS